MQVTQRDAAVSPVNRSMIDPSALTRRALSDLERPAIRRGSLAAGAAALALLIGETFRAPPRPVSVVRVQAAYEIMLIAGVLAGAPFTPREAKEVFVRYWSAAAWVRPLGVDRHSARWPHP